MVLLEDTGALVGLVFALVGVGLTVLTGDPVWDGIGTVAIGVLLGAIAVILMVEMHSLLIGEGATKEEDHAIRTVLEQTDNVDRLIHLRTQYLGPDGAAGWREDRVAAVDRLGHRGLHHRRGGGRPPCGGTRSEGHLSRTRSRSGADALARLAARRSASHSRMLCRMVRATSRVDGTM